MICHRSLVFDLKFLKNIIWMGDFKVVQIIFPSFRICDGQKGYLSLFGLQLPYNFSHFSYNNIFFHHSNCISFEAIRR